MATTETTTKPAYTSAWQDQLKDITDRIMNREKFSYDINGDALYRQYKDQYVNQGRMAMMDTMGQAAALTGGYGNSYAQGVGQQAFNGYLQQMNNIIPELYQLALSRHQMEGDELNNKFAILSARDEQDYGRHRDTVADSQWQAEFDEAVRQFNFANKLGEFAPVASSGGSSGGSGGSGVKKKTDDTEPETESTDNTSIEDKLNEYIRNGASKSEIGSYISSQKQSGKITSSKANELKKTYTPKGQTY